MLFLIELMLRFDIFRGMRVHQVTHSVKNIELGTSTEFCRKELCACDCVAIVRPGAAVATVTCVPIAPEMIAANEIAHTLRAAAPFIWKQLKKEVMRGTNVIEFT